MANKIIDAIFEKLIDWNIAVRSNPKKTPILLWSKNEQSIIEKSIEEQSLQEAPELVYKRLKRKLITGRLDKSDSRYFYKLKDKIPLEKLGWLYQLESLNSQKVKAGFYIMEVNLESKKYSSDIPLLIACKKEKKIKPYDQFNFICQSLRIKKRFLLISEDCYITIESDKTRDIKINHLNLIKVTSNFFYMKILNKIGQPQSFEKITKMSEGEKKIAWLEYNSQNEVQQLTNKSYSEYLSQIEENSIPAPKQHISILKRLGLKP